jgi:hypothetical protein
VFSFFCDQLKENCPSFPYASFYVTCFLKKKIASYTRVCMFFLCFLFTLLFVNLFDVAQLTDLIYLFFL